MTNNKITNTENLLLCNFEDNLNISEEPIYIQHLWNGNWESLIKNDLTTNILNNYNNERDIQNIFNNLQLDQCEETFCIGIASLFVFIQSNFTGPELPKSITDFIIKSDDENVQQYFDIDSEEIDVNAKHLEFLAIAKCIFENSVLNNSNIAAWWYMRYVIIYQYLLDECSETLYSKVKEKTAHLDNWDISDRLKAKLHLEQSQLHLLYGQVNESEKSLNSAKELLRMSFELAGELGKRTKFQQSDIAQIMLRISLTDGVDRLPFNASNIPDVIKLDDEVRLDKIQYCNGYEPPILPITEQNAVLATVQYMQRAKPQDELLLEESEAFLSALLFQNNNWAIRFNALLLRCLLESKHKRTIERALSQCESLVTHLNQELPSVVERFSTLWSAGMQPRWKTEAHLANLTLNLGLVKASLDLYLRLQMWEEVIVCYTIMQLRHKAAEVIEAQLKVNPTVKLWCLLGDATDDISCFEKAWDLSKHKSSRPQRHWGQFLFARKEYLDCIPHLQKSLEINSLQNMVWLRLGYAALNIEDWKLAATAYRRYTYLEPGGFEAWNNLGKAYIKLGEKNRAHYALQEALKFSFDNWKIWDNFMVVSATIGHFSDVIRSYIQILDLKEKHLDTEVLFLLTQDLISNTNSESRNDRLLIETRELFGRLTSLYPNEAQLWEMYADISPTAELKATRLFRAYRGLVQDDWFKNPEKCGKVLEICRRLGEETVKAGNATNASSTRLTLRSAVAAARKHWWEQHENLLKQVEDVLVEVMNLSNV